MIFKTKDSRKKKKKYQKRGELLRKKREGGEKWDFMHLI
jgi:hypothetical protein